MKKSICFVCTQIALALCLIMALSPLVSFANDSDDHALYFCLDTPSSHGCKINFSNENEFPDFLKTSGMKMSLFGGYPSTWDYSNSTHTHSIRGTDGEVAKVVFDFELPTGCRVNHFMIKDSSRNQIGASAGSPFIIAHEGYDAPDQSLFLDVEFSMQTNFGASEGGSLTAQGSVSNRLTSGNYYPEQEVTFTASPHQGYEVAGWYQDSGFTTPISGTSTQSEYTTSLNEPLNVYVQYQALVVAPEDDGTPGTVVAPVDDGAPGTGDDVDLRLPLLLLAVGGIGVGACLLRSRKHEKG